MKEQQKNWNFVINRPPHPLKTYLLMQQVMHVIVGLLTVVGASALWRYWHFNILTPIGILIVFKLAAYWAEKRYSLQNLSFEEKQDLMRALQEDYDAFVNATRTVAVCQITGLFIGAMILLIVDHFYI